VKRSEIRRFVERCLDRQGARVSEVGPALVRVELPVDEGEAAEKKLLAFGKRVHQQNPEAELVAVGSAFLDHLVNRAASEGRFTVSFRPPPDEMPDPPASKSLPEVGRATWARPKPAYRPVFLFVYVAEYRTIDVPDDLELIALDPARGEAVSPVGPLIEGMKSGLTEAPEGWEVLGTLPTRGALLRSLALLDQRLQRRARRVKEAAALEIARETANIEAYYRQLIEEVRHPVGRARHSPEDEAGRVRALQLDWKRRVQEVARFWEAGVTVRLSALGAWMEPCWAWPLRGRGPRGGRRGTGRIYLAADPISGLVHYPRCPLCGERVRGEAEVSGADLVCPDHLEADSETESAVG